MVPPFGTRLGAASWAFAPRDRQLPPQRAPRRGVRGGSGRPLGARAPPSGRGSCGGQGGALRGREEEPLPPAGKTDELSALLGEGTFRGL